MIEDKLGQEQRIRLEALSQSIATIPFTREAPYIQEILERANAYEWFILNGRVPDDSSS